MNLFTRTFSKIFRSSNQQELDKIQNLILAINDKESEIKSLSESDFKEKARKNVTLVKSAAKGDCYASISAHISGLSLPTFPAGF